MTNQTSALLALAKCVAGLNPKAGEIGPGMLASLVEQARAIVGEPGASEPSPTDVRASVEAVLARFPPINHGPIDKGEYRAALSNVAAHLRAAAGMHTQLSSANAVLANIAHPIIDDRMLSEELNWRIKAASTYLNVNNLPTHRNHREDGEFGEGATVAAAPTAPVPVDAQAALLAAIEKNTNMLEWLGIEMQGMLSAWQRDK